MFQPTVVCLNIPRVFFRILCKWFCHKFSFTISGKNIPIIAIIDILLIFE